MSYQAWGQSAGHYSGHCQLRFQPHTDKSLHLTSPPQGSLSCFLPRKKKKSRLDILQKAKQTQGNKKNTEHRRQCKPWGYLGNRPYDMWEVLHSSLSFLIQRLIILPNLQEMYSHITRHPRYLNIKTKRYL